MRRCDWFVSRSPTSTRGAKAGAGSKASGAGEVGEAAEELVDAAVGVEVVEVADDERAAAAARPAALAEGDDRRRA